MLAVGLPSPLLASDSLSPHKVTFAGTLTQPSPIVPGKQVTLTLTAKNLLELFGVTGVLASDTIFAFDTTAGSYVLASKDRQTIYGTVLTFDPNDFFSYSLSGQPYNPQFNSYNGGGAITMLNGALKGTAYYGVYSKGTHAIEPATFLAYGKIGSTVTLIKGSVLESGSNPP